MKFGIVPINLDVFTDPDMLVPFVQRAEALVMSRCGRLST